MRNRKALQIISAALASGLLLAVLPGAQAGPAPLQQVEKDGFLQWLHSLERSVAGRQALDLDEGALLYPFGIPGWQEGEPRPYRHLTISKALAVLEKQYRNRDRSQGIPALVALANARNYMNLSEFDSALTWYDLAAKADTAGDFRQETRFEAMACAAAAKDSLRMVDWARRAMGQAENLLESEQEFVLLLRWSLTNGAGDLSDLLEGELRKHRADLSPTLVYWLAYCNHRHGRHEEVVDLLRELVMGGGLSHGLTEGQRAWVLTALADGFFLTGLTGQARSLYESLMTSTLESLSLWGRYQVAGLDLAVGRYQEAAVGFETVCKARRLGTWQDNACDMTRVAEELGRIRKEGEAYGVAKFYAP